MKMRKLLMLLVLLGVIVAFSGILQAEEYLSDIFSVSFYRYGGALDTDEKKATITLEENESAGFGDWNTIGWFNAECGWNPAPPDENPDTLISSGGAEAQFYFHDTRNGNSYSGARTENLGDGNHDMMDGHGNGTAQYDDGELPDAKHFSIEITDIPFATYDLILYLGTQAAQEGSGKGKYIFNGGSEKDFFRTLGIFDGTFVECVDGETSGNYLLFEGLTDSSFTFEIWGNNADHIGLAGLQFGVTDTLDPTPADESLVVGYEGMEMSWMNVDPNVVVDVYWSTDPCDVGDPCNIEFGPVHETLEVTSETGEKVRSSVFVDTSTYTTYYWRVITKLIDFPDANDVISPMWTYTTSSEIPPTVDMITTPKMIWTGYSLLLETVVENLGFLDTEIAWTHDAGSDALVEFDPVAANTANTTVTITKLPYSDAKIVNAGFEAVLAGEAPDDWGPEPPTGWGAIVRSGTWNPPADSYSGIYGSGTNVPEGQMCGWAGNNGGGISQVLNETLAADTQYELSVQVGNSMRYEFSGYTVQLLAGGEVLVEDVNDLVIPRDDWALVTIPFDSTDVDPALVGQPLEIRLLNQSAFDDPYAEINFDDVKLTADPAFPAAAVQTVNLTISVNDAGDDTVNTATVQLDVYDSACHVAREGEGKDNVADLNESCLVGIGDIKLLAEEWLIDSSLTGAGDSIIQTATNTIYNGEFNLYKPGTRGLIASIGHTGTNYITGVGENVIGRGGTFTFEDGTSGITVAVPGWEVTSVHVGNLLRDGVDNSWCFHAFGQWGGTGSRIQTATPAGAISDGTSLSLSAMVRGNPGPRLLRLLADGVEVVPTSFVDPPEDGDWAEISRVYEPAELAAYTGQLITVELGITDPHDTDVGSTSFDNVELVATVTDANLPGVDAGNDTVTMHEVEITLTPTVTDNGDILERDMSYLWTAEPSDGVVFSDPVNPADPNTSDVLDTKVTISKPLVYIPYMADAGLNDEGGWDAYGGGTGYWGGDFTGYEPEGGTVGYVWNAPAGDNGFAQILATTLQADTDYELSVWLGTPNGYAPVNSYKVQLLVNGTVLAENDDNSVPATGTMIQSTVPFDSTGVDAGLVGQPLEIRLLGVFGETDAEIDFDDVKLLIDGKEKPIVGPDPYSVVLKLAVTLDGGGDPVIVDHILVTVYNDGCQALMDDNPMLDYAVTDLNGDCITNLTDFADVAAQWLVDYEADGPVEIEE